MLHTGVTIELRIGFVIGALALLVLSFFFYLLSFVVHHVLYSIQRVSLFIIYRSDCSSTTTTTSAATATTTTMSVGGRAAAQSAANRTSELLCASRVSRGGDLRSRIPSRRWDPDAAAPNLHCQRLVHSVCP